jgi:hypothetical protein
MTLCRLLPVLLVTTLSVGLAAPAAEAQIDAGSGIVINDINLDGVQLVDGVLTATGGTVTGTIAGLPFTTDITNFALDLLPDVPGACSILNLELGPIDVDLLGLHVDTSQICLSLTAFAGQGLLGDLLCGLADGFLLNLDLEGLLDGLTDVIGPVLTAALADGQAPGQGAADICDGECEILDLALGPIDLTLLGLNILLDNCEGGPVQVCVSASAGEGLLGDLLCGLLGGGLNINLGDLEGLVNAILDTIGNRELTPRQVTKLVNRLVDLVGDLLQDGTLSDKDLGKIVKAVRQVLK